MVRLAGALVRVRILRPAVALSARRRVAGWCTATVRVPSCGGGLVRAVVRGQPAPAVPVAIAALASLVVVSSLLAAPSAAAAPPSGSGTTAPSLVQSNRYLDRLCWTSRFALPVLRGSSSSRSGTRVLQYSLVYLGYRPGPVDGLYGPVTRRAVRAFQRDWRLVVDGLTGPQTWGQLQWLIC